MSLWITRTRPVAARILVADGGATVGRTVVDQDNLKVRIRLGKDAVDAGAQIRFDGVDGHDDGDKRVGRSAELII